MIEKLFAYDPVLAWDKLLKRLEKRRIKLREKWNINQDDLELDCRMDELIRILEMIEAIKMDCRAK